VEQSVPLTSYRSLKNWMDSFDRAMYLLGFVHLVVLQKLIIVNSILETGSLSICK